MKTINKMINLRLLALLFAGLLVTSCSDDDDAVPEEENEIEVITNVNLIFTPTDGGDVVMASAVDPDGAGIMELEVLNAIELSVDTEYTLTYMILNALDPTDVEDIGDEVREEDNEHQIFYSFTNDAFGDPTGDGNFDNAADPVNYTAADLDENGNNVGLITTWTTSDIASTEGEFTTRLQHQPDLKSATTGVNDGDTDFELTFVLNVN